MKDSLIKTELIEWRELNDLQPKGFKTDTNFGALKVSLKKHGFSQPFYAWRDEKGKAWVVDGHTRKEALNALILEGEDIPDVLPCTFIEADSKKEAARLLLDVFNQKQNQSTNKYPFFQSLRTPHRPFLGTATVAYIPNDKIVGLSKLARTVDLYANRFQNQERITTQIAERIMKELSPKGVAVTLKAQHLCMAMRGVKKHDTWTQTSKMMGVFKDNEKHRNEFLQLIL